jgi:hypothetical protein
VAFELASETEFAQLVADHVLGDVHRDELLAVMHCDGVSHHFRNNGGAPRPGAQYFLFVACVHRLNPGLQVSVDERAFLG